jgi:hypothetical protein
MRGRFPKLLMLKLLSQMLVHLPNKFVWSGFLMIWKTQALHKAPNDTIRFVQLIPVGIDLRQHDAEVLLQSQFTKQLKIEGLA